MSKPHIQKHSDKIYEMHITLSFKKRSFFIKYSYKETECHKYDTLIYSINKTIIANEISSNHELGDALSCQTSNLLHRLLYKVVLQKHWQHHQQS